MKKIKVSEICKHIDRKIDMFVCSASFEDRCRIIPDGIAKQDVDKTLVFINKDKEEPLSCEGDEKIKKKEEEAKNTNANHMLSIFKKNSKLIEISRNEPIFSAETFLAIIKETVKPRKKQNVVVDVTTFTHEALLILFKILYLYNDKINNIFFIYNIAKDYAYRTENKNEKWLTKGIKEIRTILGYPGKFKPQNKLHLVVLVGCEEERAAKIIEEYEPSVLSFGIGSRRQTISNNLLSINFEQISQFDFSCDNPGKTKIDVLNQAQKFPEYNIVVAPMNNKVSTIGAGLAAIENPDIQLCYASAIIYNTDDYSLPSDECYLFSLSDLI